MKRRVFIGGVLALLPAVAGGPALSARISIAEISAYLNSLVRARGEFTQLNPDGRTARGRFYLHRPGRMRLEYLGPDAPLVIAGSGRIAIFDARARQAQQYPLSASPLGLFLSTNIDLSDSSMVLAHFESGGRTSLVLRSPENPQYGTLQIILKSEPTRITNWVVTDAYERPTFVTLESLETDVEFASTLFNINLELQKRNPE